MGLLQNFARTKNLMDDVLGAEAIKVRIGNVKNTLQTWDGSSNEKPVHEVINFEFMKVVSS